MTRRTRFEIICDDPESRLLAHNPRFVQLLEEARQRVRISGGVSVAEFQRRLKSRSSNGSATSNRK